MCGIVGAVSSRNIVPILVEGLKRLLVPSAKLGSVTLESVVSFSEG